MSQVPSLALIFNPQNPQLPPPSADLCWLPTSHLTVGNVQAHAKVDPEMLRFLSSFLWFYDPQQLVAPRAHLKCGTRHTREYVYVFLNRLVYLAATNKEAIEPLIETNLNEIIRRGHPLNSDESVLKLRELLKPIPRLGYRDSNPLNNQTTNIFEPGKFVKQAKTQKKLQRLENIGIRPGEVQIDPALLQAEPLTSSLVKVITEKFDPMYRPEPARKVQNTPRAEAVGKQPSETYEEMLARDKEERDRIDEIWKMQTPAKPTTDRPVTETPNNEVKGGDQNA